MPSVAEQRVEIVPATASELARKVAENAAGAGLPIYAAGGRTSWFSGRAASMPGITLSTADLVRVVDYPSRDMTVTVEAGIRVADLAALLASQGQRLAVDIPQAHRATLGGALAANASGPRRFGLGTLRDYLIGVSAVDASGRMFKAGGRVVKNVTGYDLCKLLVGSLGTLAVITQATLKLKPLPQHSRLLWASFDHPAAIEQALVRLTTSAARPVAIELLDARAADSVVMHAGLTLPSNRFVLCLAVEGTERETTWQLDTLRSELSGFEAHGIEPVAADEAERMLSALTEFQVPSDDPLCFKATLLPSKTVEFVQQAHTAGCAVQAHAGNGIVFGHLPDTVASAKAAETMLGPLRQCARGCGGDLTVTFCDESWKPELLLAGAPTPSRELMRRLKRELDPKNLLNPQHGFE